MSAGIARLGAFVRLDTGRMVRTGVPEVVFAEAHVDLDGLDTRLADTRFSLASDVDSPMLGARGAATVFGPQKHASPGEVAQLERPLSMFAARVTAVVWRDYTNHPVPAPLAEPGSQPCPYPARAANRASTSSVASWASRTQSAAVRWWSSARAAWTSRA
jgi:hypothetical protein